MDLEFAEVGDGEAESSALAGFLSEDEWPFHGNRRPTRETADGWLAAGNFYGPNTRSFWIRTSGEAGAQAIGVVTLHDLADPTPLFDLRLRTVDRGRGYGTAAVRWLTEYLFTELPEIKRIEGHTRSDNVAMQRVFARCGYVREAHHRQAWNNSDGTVHDSYGYAILRQDWLTGDSTPVDF